MDATTDDQQGACSRKAVAQAKAVSLPMRGAALVLKNVLDPPFKLKWCACAGPRGLVYAALNATHVPRYRPDISPSNAAVLVEQLKKCVTSWLFAFRWQFARREAGPGPLAETMSAMLFVSLPHSEPLLS